MIQKTNRIGLFMVGVALVFCLPAGSHEKITIFNNQPTAIIVHGYSTSFHWPEMLKDKIDRHFGNHHKIKIWKAVKGGTPIAKWIDVKNGEPKPAWNQILTPILNQTKDQKRILLAQQSLQWVYGDRKEGIRNQDDEERINIGADALEMYAQRLHDDGADLVFVAMHIYKHPMEPEIGNERFALLEVLQRKRSFLLEGPDVWEPTKQLYPQAFAKDKLHPNKMGAEILARNWFAVLLRHDGLPEPDWNRSNVEIHIQQNE